MTYEEFMKGIEIKGALSANFKVEAEAAAQYFLNRASGSREDPTPEVLRDCLKKFIAKRVARKYLIKALKEPSFDMKVGIWDDYPDVLFSEDELEEIFLQAAAIRSDLLVKGRL